MDTAIKLDWIGPSLLAVLPWLACLMSQQRTVLQHWLRTGPALICGYVLILGCLTYGQPALINQKLFSSVLTISWQELTKKFYQVAVDISRQIGSS